jgi:hypothetical protein
MALPSPKVGNNDGPALGNYDDPEGLKVGN